MNEDRKSTPDETGELVPATISELGRLLAANAKGDRRPVLPIGGRTSLGFGFPADSASVEVKPHDWIGWSIIRRET